MVTRELIERTKDSTIRLAGGWGNGDVRRLCDVAEAALAAREALEKALLVVDYATSEETAVRTLLSHVPSLERDALSRVLAAARDAQDHAEKLSQGYMDTIDKLRALLREIREELDQEADVGDGTPNLAARLLVMIDSEEARNE